MPWKECNLMDERHNFIARLLNGGMAVLCREFGISRKSGYKPDRLRSDLGADIAARSQVTASFISN